MKLYVVRDDVAQEDVSCFFMQNVETLRRSFADCLEDVENGKGRKPGFLREGFSVLEYSKSKDCSNNVENWIFDNVWSMRDLLPEA